jgi:DNA-binding MarR family transcriptional regulator
MTIKKATKEIATRHDTPFRLHQQHTFAEPWRNDNVGRAMFEAARRFEIDVIAYLEKAGLTMIRPAHLTVFRYLDTDGTRLVDLATRANMTKQGMQDLVDKLERLGIVERLPDPGDRRAKFVVLTTEGHKVFDVVHEAVLAGDRRMAEITGEIGCKDVVASLRRYAQGN